MEGGQGPRVVIYEVSKTLYTPTRQRAGLAPRNPVLALTHRYLSHDHFRSICARGGTLHTYARPRASSTLHGVFTIYSAPRVGNAVGYLVDIVYLGYSRPHDPRDFSSRLSLRPPPEEEASAKRLLSAGPPIPWRQMVQWHISLLGQRRLVAVVDLRHELQQHRVSS